MSGAEKIKDRILADARDLREAILADAGQEAQSIIGNAEKEAFQRVTVMTEKAKEEAVRIKQRFHAAEGMEDKKKILKARQDSIDEAFSNALSRLSGLPGDQYRLFLESIALDAAREEEGTILFNEKDKARLGGGFVAAVNSRLAEKGKKAVLKLGEETLNTSGGFIIRYGDMEINCTLDVILNMARPNLESEVAAILFED